MCSIQLLELTLPLEKEVFDALLERAISTEGIKNCWEHGLVHETDFGYVDKSLSSKGILVAYYNDRKKKKIRLIVFPCLVIGNGADELWAPTSDNISRLLDKLEKRIDTYFQSNYSLTDFRLSKVNLALDINVGGPEKPCDFIKIMRNVGKVKLFSPAKRDDRGERINKDRCFALDGISNGIAFRAYALENVLRIEVRLTKKSVIRAYTEETDTCSQLETIAKKCKIILMETFRWIIPPGDFYKKKQLELLIHKNVPDVCLRRKMLNLVRLIPAKKSIHMAIKYLNARDIGDIVSKFEEIGVAPVTISKRHEVTKLRSLYSYLEN